MSLSVEQVLKKRKADLHGRAITPEEAADLNARLGSDLLPPSLLDWMLSHALAETEFSLGEEEDESGLGVEMQWLTPAQMISETIEAYPGIAAGPAGYLPVGSCLIGSGDYYYISARSGDDPPLVRIPHEAVDADDKLELDQIERVSSRLSEFLSKAQTG